MSFKCLNKKQHNRPEGALDVSLNQPSSFLDVNGMKNGSSVNFGGRSSLAYHAQINIRK